LEKKSVSAEAFRRELTIYRSGEEQSEPTSSSSAKPLERKRRDVPYRKSSFAIDGARVNYLKKDKADCWLTFWRCGRQEKKTTSQEETAENLRVGAAVGEEGKIPRFQNREEKKNSIYSPKKKVIVGEDDKNKAAQEMAQKALMGRAFASEILHC